MLAYFDCFSGISGDITLGALMDLGVPLEWIKDCLGGILPEDFDITVTAVQSNGIHASLVDVQTFEDRTARNFSQIRSLIQNSSLTDTVKSTSLQIFQKLAEAEARIHSCPPDQVHFHEVGGVDAIVDIVGTALCLEFLGVKKVYASQIPLGKGFVNCSHGRLPVPSPATLSILEGVPVYGTNIPHEMVTPTGAAIIAGLAEGFGAMPEMVVRRVGYGARQRNLDDRPNLLRVVLGSASSINTFASEALPEDQIEIIETCIDDMNPEWFGYLMERLFEDGALDVYWIPIYMKKNRPGTMLQIICRIDKRDDLIRRVLSETTTLGVRYYQARRRLLGRDELQVKTSYGIIAVKMVKDLLGNSRMIPEYEVCRKIAIEKNIPLRVVYDTITSETSKMNL